MPALPTINNTVDTHSIAAEVTDQAVQIIPTSAPAKGILTVVRFTDYLLGIGAVRARSSTVGSQPGNAQRAVGLTTLLGGWLQCICRTLGVNTVTDLYHIAVPGGRATDRATFFPLVLRTIGRKAIAELGAVT